MIKKNIEDLSIFGGVKAYQTPLHIGKPNVVNREVFLQYVDDILDTQWLTNNGPYLRKFEKKISQQLGVKHVIAVSNGTVALELAIRALGMSGEVIVPSFTFVATAHALQWQEITPVFCDINPNNFTLDTKQIEHLITPKTTGIIAVNLWGRICNIDALTHIANKHQLKILYDSAHAFGCEHNKTMIGNFGDAEIFSFHATKMINSLEGGAITTNNDTLAKKLRLMRNFGFESEDNVIYIGTNGKMNEISAAMGLCSLKKIQDIIAVNKRNYLHYVKRLQDTANIRIIEYVSNSTYPYITLYVDTDASPLDRDDIVTILQNENILARRYFYPGCHNMEPYRSFFPHAGLLLHNTNSVVHKTLCLPTGISISEHDIDNITSLIRFIIDNASAIKKRLLTQSL